MVIDWGKVAPVIVSIIIIIAVAILRQYSRAFAAIAATMPINIPLALWIVGSGGEETTSSMASFSKTMVFNMLPTVGFIFVAWLAFRSGWTLVPSILIGYLAWGIGLLAIIGLRQWLGV